MNAKRNTRKTREKIKKSKEIKMKGSAESILVLIPLLIIFSFAFQLVVINYAILRSTFSQQSAVNKAGLFSEQIDSDAKNQLGNQTSYELIGGGKILISQGLEKAPVLQRVIRRLWIKSASFTYDENS